MTTDEVIQESFRILDAVLIEALNEPCNAEMPGYVKAELDHIIRARFKSRVLQMIEESNRTNVL